MSFKDILKHISGVSRWFSGKDITITNTQKNIAPILFSDGDIQNIIQDPTISFKEKWMLISNKTQGQEKLKYQKELGLPLIDKNNPEIGHNLSDYYNYLVYLWNQGDVIEAQLRMFGLCRKLYATYSRGPDLTSAERDLLFNGDAWEYYVRKPDIGGVTSNIPKPGVMQLPGGSGVWRMDYFEGKLRIIDGLRKIMIKEYENFKTCEWR